MGRAPCCDKANVKKGPWSQEEDSKLKDYIHTNGTGGNWIALPQKAGLRRCGKSCRLRWLNYLRPNIKHGDFSEDEDRVICSLYATIGSRWSIIAAQLPGRTDNDIKNYWNTKLKKKFMAFASASTITASIRSEATNPPMHSAYSQLSSLYNYNYASNPTITTNSNPNPNPNNPNSTKTLMDQPFTLHQMITSNKSSQSCLETSLSLFQITQMQNQQYYHPLMFGSTTDHQQTSCSSNNSDNGGSCGNKNIIGKFQNFTNSCTTSSVVLPSALEEQDLNKGFMLNNYEENNNNVFMSKFDSMNSSSEASALMGFYDNEGGDKQLNISINDLSLINIGDHQNYQVINNKQITSLDHQALMKERDQRMMMMHYFNSNYF